MAFKLFDYACFGCDHEYEELVDAKDTNARCPECGHDNIPCLSVPKLGMFSMMDQTQRTEHLKQRSAKHTQTLVDKNPEKWGNAGLERRTRKIRNLK